MAAWEWIAADLRTNALLGSLPLSGVSFGESLNGAGPFSATLPALGDAAISPTERRTIAALRRAAVTPGRTVIWPRRDGVLFPPFIIWRRTGGGAGPYSISGLGLWSYFRAQHLRVTKTYAATDQLAIARDLIAAAQAPTGADIGVVGGTESSGVLRDRSYQAYEVKQIGEAVEQLAAVDGGFDFGIDITPAFGKVLTLSFPRRGRIAGTTGIVFESGKNLLDYTEDVDAGRQATIYTAIGAGDGADMLTATAARTDLIDAGFPLLSAVGSFKDVSRQNTLDAHARAGVNARAVTPTFFELTVDPDDPDGGAGTFIVGDDALFVVGDDETFPRQADGSPGYRAYHRILSYSFEVPDEGKDTMKIQLGEAIG
jgi:hypothetical protein